MSRFGKVWLSADRQLERRASMTLLKHYQGCPRSGYFYAEHKGEAQTMEMIRGSAVHEIIERAIEAMIGEGEQTIPPDLNKVIVNEVLAEQAVPFREHDFIREMSHRWADEWAIDPQHVIACETLIVLDLAGWQVRCKIDFAELAAGGLVCKVADWKSSRAAPGFEEIARKRPDGSLAAKSFQLILYALALAYGQPVRVEQQECPACSGSGWWAEDREENKPCNECGGGGTIRVEITEPFPLAGGVERFDLELVFPAIERKDDGTMVRRPVSLTRLELGEYRESLIALLKRMEESEQTGDWPAILSDEACSECPCRPECPIPKELRDHAGEINSLEQAVEAAEVLDRRKAEQAALRKELKLWAKAHGVEIRYGKDKAWRFGYSESDRIEHKEEMFDAIQRAIDYGETFRRSEFVRAVGSTTFDPVTLTEDELAEEAGEKEQAA